MCALSYILQDDIPLDDFNPHLLPCRVSVNLHAGARNLCFDCAEQGFHFLLFGFLLGLLADKRRSNFSIAFSNFNAIFSRSFSSASRA